MNVSRKQGRHRGIMQDPPSRIGTIRSDTQPFSTTWHPPVPLGIRPQKRPGAGTSPIHPDFRVFGSRAFVHIPDAHRSKLTGKSLVCTFLGNIRNSKAYRELTALPHRSTRHFLESRDVIFDEGGPAPQTSFEHVVIEHDNADTVNAEAGGVNADNATLQIQETLGKQGRENRKRNAHHRFENPSTSNDPRCYVSSYSAGRIVRSTIKRELRDPARSSSIK